jgi:tRNA (mo5U34)-methyltransferase
VDGKILGATRFGVAGIMMSEKLKPFMDGSFYQTFDFLGEELKASNSAEKYDLSRLTTFNLEGKDILDVGCNAGYFMFKLLGKNPKSIFGIDAHRPFIDIARRINEECFQSNKLDFHVADFFKYKFPLGKMFDFIFCFSTFHYFYENQQLFIDKSYELLNKDGILLLEIEESPDQGEAKIFSPPRPADGKCYFYPNQAIVKQWTKGIFKIVDKYVSVKQNGAVYDRQFYVFQKL